MSGWIQEQGSGVSAFAWSLPDENRTMLRRAHLWAGWIGIVVFVLTGIYMRRGFPALYGGDEVVRNLYRANHIYILFASLVNLVLGLYLSPKAGWRKKLAAVGSLLLLAAPGVLLIAFAVEAPKNSPERLLTLAGVLMVVFGTLSHVPQGRRRT